MKIALLAAAAALALALTACNSPTDDGIDPVPAQTAESANRLMSEAERAAQNATARSDNFVATNVTTENQQ